MSGAPMGCRKWFARTAAGRASLGVILVFMQKTGDLAFQHVSLQQLSHRTRVVEDLPLQLRRDRVPTRDDCSAKAAKDLILFIIVVGER